MGEGKGREEKGGKIEGGNKTRRLLF